MELVHLFDQVESNAERFADVAIAPPKWAVVPTLFDAQGNDKFGSRRSSGTIYLDRAIVELCVTTGYFTRAGVDALTAKLHADDSEFARKHGRPIPSPPRNPSATPAHISVQNGARHIAARIGCFPWWESARRGVYTLTPECVAYLGGVLASDEPTPEPKPTKKTRKKTEDGTGGIYLPKPLHTATVEKNLGTDGRFSDSLRRTASVTTDDGYFSPETLKDERERRLQEIVYRRGNAEFRKKLARAYNGRCAITGCDALAALEAAHIIPYCGPKSDRISNGLLLRADIHTLFDLYLIGIDPDTMTISVGAVLKKTTYRDLQGQPLALPSNASYRPDAIALVTRWQEFLKVE